MRLFVSGSAPLAAQTLDEFRVLFGHTILERYGMSETLMNLSNPYIGERRPGTVGFPLPGVSVRLLGPEGQAVADGETLARARAIALDPGEAFRKSDAFTFFSKLEDALVTGPTGNNLRDLRILLAEP